MATRPGTGCALLMDDMQVGVVERACTRWYRRMSGWQRAHRRRRRDLPLATLPLAARTRRGHTEQGFGLRRGVRSMTGRSSCRCGVR